MKWNPKRRGKSQQKLTSFMLQKLEKIWELKAGINGRNEIRVLHSFYWEQLEPQPPFQISFKWCHYSFTTLAKQRRFHLWGHYTREILCLWTPRMVGQRWGSWQIILKTERLRKSLHAKLWGAPPWGSFFGSATKMLTGRLKTPRQKTKRFLFGEIFSLREYS